MIILNILMILLGLSTLVYSFFEIRVWGGLYFERDYHCIERFRKQNKVTDLVSCIHNIAKCAFGLAVVIAGLKRWMPEENLGLAHAVLFVSFGLLVVDVLALEGATRMRGLKQLRSEIRNQWDKEKVVSKDHDHEVNMYRGTVRVTSDYPRHVIIMGVSMIVIELFFI